jgi:hypothetical protein
MLCHAFTMAHFEFHSGQKLPTIRLFTNDQPLGTRHFFSPPLMLAFL